MRIRIRPDDSQDQGEPAGGRTILIQRQEDTKGAPQQTKKSGAPEQTPRQTTWAMVSCQCTETGRSYQLAFRREEGTYVLKSVDRTVMEGTSKDISGVDGPFDWAIFRCPECGRGWQKSGDTEPRFPIVLCSCQSLFCSKNGVTRNKGSSGDEWRWHCPKCGIDDRIRTRIDTLKGQALKGK